MKCFKILSLLLLFSLAACTTTPSTPAPSYGTKTLQGLFGVVTPSTSQSGHFIWMQNGSNFTLELYGPLGLGATTLSQSDGEDILKTAEGQTYEADSPEALLYQVLGWSMPVSGFSYWLWGKADPDTPYTWSDNVLNQDEWQITYIRNGDQINKMIMLRDNVKVTVVIKHDE